MAENIYEKKNQQRKHNAWKEKENNSHSPFKMNNRSDRTNKKINILNFKQDANESIMLKQTL